MSTIKSMFQILDLQYYIVSKMVNAMSENKHQHCLFASLKRFSIGKDCEAILVFNSSEDWQHTRYRQNYAPFGAVSTKQVEELNTITTTDRGSIHGAIEHYCVQSIQRILPTHFLCTPYAMFTVIPFQSAKVGTVQFLSFNKGAKVSQFELGLRLLQSLLLIEFVSLVQTQ